MSETAKPIWDEHSDRAFAEMQAPLDRQLAPLGHRAQGALAAKPGERILDIGCGAGQTSLELAQAVGVTGKVLGLDISPGCLAIARKRAAQTPQVEFILGDAQTYDFKGGDFKGGAFPRFDGVFSRFGVMFFADPTTAFRNIRTALKPGGRLAFVCWRDPKEVELLTLPFNTVKHLLPEQPPPVPDAPGPFGLANAQRTKGILTDAGYSDIAITAYDEKVGSGDVEVSLALALRVGVLGRIVRENPELKDTVIGPVRAALAAHDTPDGVRLNAATWIVTARC
jgi:SAM-dependent methyltransferase